MIFSRVILPFFAAGAVFAGASPVPTIEKRADVSDVLSVVGTLQSATDTILPQIDTLTNSIVLSRTATADAVAPLINEVTSALSTAASSLSTLGSIDTTSRGTVQDIANAISPIVSNIVATIINAQSVVPGPTSYGPITQILSGPVNLLNILLADIGSGLSETPVHLL